MPPKPKDNIKKPTQIATRPIISDSSLLRIPENAIEGYQQRILTDIDWTLLEKAFRHHKLNCERVEISQVSLKEALKKKVESSILRGFLDESSTLTLQDQWELFLPITLWEIEKFANSEGMICFQNNNSITNDLVKLIRKAVKLNDREILRKELKAVDMLRINEAEITKLDCSLRDYKNLVTLTLCLNYLKDIDATVIPEGVRILELQANRISSVELFAKDLPTNLLYLGLSRNFISNDVESLASLPQSLTVLDLSDNDIYNLNSTLDVLVELSNLTSLLLAGNPCSVCAGYARATLTRLPRLKCLDNREVLSIDRVPELLEPHPDDLRSAYFYFTVIRIMSVPQPPKPEKGATTTFHVELELPLLDSNRRNFLMYHTNESLIQMMPPPEDDIWHIPSSMTTSKIVNPVRDDETSIHESDIYHHLTVKNSRQICNYTTFESNKIQWNKVMNFQEPTVKIFCPDLVALRDTFRTVVTIKLVYTVTSTAKQGKTEKKSVHSMKMPNEQIAVLATVKCSLSNPDWSQISQHFHWDDTLGTEEAIHWGEGDLTAVQYSQAPVKTPKGKPQADAGSSRQSPPDNLTCHFAFGIETLRL
ncbi:uncharacterized protein LOC114245955 [Bombyx mandarina]|uniref:Uncharacterized protein LOC114245955 n=1 Tax=Bombyx mandarina TaxID=7092 RepID=A0A6J2JX23_BOMMA|nr:uncharacterized protein LOC114245955 [Bombyx mandarina]